MCMSPKYIKNPGSLGLWPSWKRFVEIPCGKCDECRISKAREWGMRCVAELISMPKEEQSRSWFITLTYSDEFNTGVLVKSHMKKFIKDLRNKYRMIRIKYFYCGEYGSKTYRPHYHLILFNCPIDDLEYFGETKSGYPNFVSKTVEKIWGKGIVSIGWLNLASASYTARYSLKKNTTDCYQRMSQGIGKKYFFSHMKEIISSGCIGVPNGNGSISYGPIPRYFLKLYRKYLNNNFEYAKFIKWYTKNVKKKAEQNVQCFADLDDVDYITRQSVGVVSKKQFRLREARRLLNQALHDMARFRDF